MVIDQSNSKEEHRDDADKEHLCSASVPPTAVRRTTKDYLLSLDIN